MRYDVVQKTNERAHELGVKISFYDTHQSLDILEAMTLVFSRVGPSIKLPVLNKIVDHLDQTIESYKKHLAERNVNLLMQITSNLLWNHYPATDFEFYHVPSVYAFALLLDLKSRGFEPSEYLYWLYDTPFDYKNQLDMYQRFILEIHPDQRVDNIGQVNEVLKNDTQYLPESSTLHENLIEELVDVESDGYYQAIPSRYREVLHKWLTTNNEV